MVIREASNRYDRVGVRMKTRSIDQFPHATDLLSWFAVFAVVACGEPSRTATPQADASKARAHAVEPSSPPKAVEAEPSPSDPPSVAPDAAPEPAAPPAEPPPWEQVRWSVGVGDERPTRGPDDALVTMVTWVDYGCRECTATLPTLGALVEAHPEMRFALRFAPHTTHSRPAAQAVLSAGRQGKLWEAHAAVVALGERIDPAAVRAAILALGVDAERLDADLESPSIAALVDEDVRIANAVRGTAPPPVFVINGYVRERWTPIETLETLITQASRDAEKVLQARMPTESGLYEAMRATWDDVGDASKPRSRAPAAEP